ncbi:hypothetical protein [Methanosarcina sp. MTP4]|uniref:hypothetical protein n=1 Tax=Methanosarcina sp. MTP4 TaxID=1434100 RepID=UPI00064EFCBF|nr:hypothetical protein [Methanosarcina sp. MTP4]
MNGNDVTQLIVKSSKVKSTIMLILICGVLNVGTDLSVGLVPGIGDVANSVIDTILLIFQIGSVAYLRSNGIEYIPNE